MSVFPQLCKYVVSCTHDTDAYMLFLRRPVQRRRPFILRQFTAPVFLQARLIFEMFCAVLANALESFLGHLTNFCERQRASLVAIIHFSRKLLESPLDRLRRALLGENASTLMSIEIAFPIERLSAIANQFHSAFFMLLPCVSVAMVRVGK